MSYQRYAVIVKETKHLEIFLDWGTDKSIVSVTPSISIGSDTLSSPTDLGLREHSKVTWEMYRDTGRYTNDRLLEGH